MAIRRNPLEDGLREWLSARLARDRAREVDTDLFGARRACIETGRPDPVPFGDPSSVLSWLSEYVSEHSASARPPIEGRAGALRFMGNLLIGRQLAPIAAAAAECPSPAHEALFLALVAVALADETRKLAICGSVLGETAIPLEVVEVASQRDLGGVTIDFVVKFVSLPDSDQFPDGHTIGIQCDADDYRDKGWYDDDRERDLRATELPLVRFRHGEILANPVSVAEWVYRHLSHQVQRKVYRAWIARDPDGFFKYASTEGREYVLESSGLSYEQWRESYEKQRLHLAPVPPRRRGPNSGNDGSMH